MLEATKAISKQMEMNVLGNKISITLQISFFILFFAFIRFASIDAVKSESRCYNTNGLLKIKQKCLKMFWFP